MTPEELAANQSALQISDEQAQENVFKHFCVREADHYYTVRFPNGLGDAALIEIRKVSGSRVEVIASGTARLHVDDKVRISLEPDCVSVKVNGIEVLAATR